MSEQRLQSLHASTQQTTGSVDASYRSPYLTSREACAYLRLNSLSSLYRHIRQNRLPVLRAGGDLRFDTRELDAWLRGTTAIELVRRKRGA